MIHVKRLSPPPYFESEKYKRSAAELNEYFSNFGQEKRRTSFGFESVGRMQKQVHPDLHEQFSHKCAYCESLIGVSTPLIIEHFRPKRGTRGFGSDNTKVSKDGLYFDNHYWWLSLDWNNLLISCQLCNRFKASWFPIIDEAKRAEAPGQGFPIEDEEPLLIDPCNDEPNEHLVFVDNGEVVAKTERGKVTIDLLKLNRATLTEQRKKALDEIRFNFDTVAKDVEQPPYAYIQTMAEVLKDEPTSRPYLGIQRQFLNEWLSDNDEVEGLVFSEVHSEMDDDYHEWIDKQESLEEIQTSPVWTKDDASLKKLLEPDFKLDVGGIAIEKIHLKNFKSIEDLTLKVPLSTEASGAPWLVFLGENAVGKSSIIQAIILTLMGDVRDREIPDLAVDDVLRYYRKDGKFVQSDEGWVKIWIVGQEEPLELYFKKGDSKFDSNVTKPQSYLIAYSSTRLLPESDSKHYESPELVRVRNLFKSSTPLIDANEWLFNLFENDSKSFDLMVRGLRDMLLMKDDEMIEPDIDNPEKKRILIDLKTETTTLKNLSDGYRTILVLACDMMSMFAKEGTSMQEADGIVIIDEIGSNLHPGWKKRIVDCFRKVFPLVQFITTTHEPLCLRGFYENEVVLLRRDIENKVVAVTNLPNPKDLKVDELLVSEFFGLSSTLETDLEEIYEEYYQLLLVKKLTSKQKKRKKELKEILRDRQHLGHGLRDELMYEVIDKLLARESTSATPKNRKNLKKETLEKVLESWQTAGLLEDYMEKS